MTEKENAAPVLQHQDGGGQIVLEGFGDPQPDCTTSSRKPQAISSLLLRGSANAVPLQHLRAVTGLDERTIRRKIHRERLAGACVCEDNRRGYFLAETLAERDTCARSMFHRSEEIRRTAEAIAAAEVEA